MFHSRVTQEILAFNEHNVLIKRRPYKRTLGLTLQPNGRIQVSVPRRTSQKEIANFLLLHLDWIETHLDQYKNLRDRYPRKSYSEGESFLFMGVTRPLRFACADVKKPIVSLNEKALLVTMPSILWEAQSAAEAQPELKALIRKFYADAGKKVLLQKLDHFSKRMGLYPSAVRVRSQKTRWGSCSASGRISLNWRLIVAPEEVIDYVVVHELSHLRHYNHSPRFWHLVSSEIPGYLSCRSWLKQHQYEADFLAEKSELHI